MSRNGRNSTQWRTRAAVLAAVGIALAGGLQPATAAGGPPMGTARSYGALAGAAVESTGFSEVTGNVGVSPGSSVTGFPPAITINGSINAGNAAAATALADANIAYAFLAGMATGTNLTGQDLAGMTLAPGTYTYNTSAFLTGDLVLDAQGQTDAVFVFQIGSTLVSSSTSSVVVINQGGDYDESNIFWQVGSSATFGSGTAFLGNVLAYASVTFVTGAGTIGGAYGLNGTVTLDASIVTSPPLVTPLPESPTNLVAAPIDPLLCAGMDLTFTDASDNETEFRVFRRDGVGPAFVQVGTILSTTTAATGGTISFQDLVPAAPETILTYRVTAFSLTDGESLPSADALVETCDAVIPTAAIEAPVTLVALLVGPPAIPGADLSWNDASDNETEFRVYRRDGSGPAFVQVGTVVSTDVSGTEGTVTFQDLILDPSSTYTYRVAAFNAVDGESLPSNEALVDTADLPPVVIPPARWLDVNLGRGRGLIRDRYRNRMDRAIVKGSFSVIDVTTSVPVVLDDMDPRTDDLSIQVRGPGNLVLLTIPADDPRWRVSTRGVYRWKSPNGRDAPVSSLRIDTRKSEFTFKSKRNDFGSVPVNSITVTLSMAGAIGSDTRAWDHQSTVQASIRALYKLEK